MVFSYSQTIATPHNDINLCNYAKNFQLIYQFSIYSAIKSYSHHALTAGS